MGTLNLGGATLSASGGNWTDAPAGTVIQMASASSGPARQTITSASPTTITGLSIDFTPRRSDSKIVISAFVSSSVVHVCGFGVFQDGSATASTTGYTNTHSPNLDITRFEGETTTQTGFLAQVPIITTLDAGSTTQRTYDIRAHADWANGGPYTLYINDRGTSDMATFSRMFIYEVAQ